MNYEFEWKRLKKDIERTINYCEEILTSPMDCETKKYLNLKLDSYKIFLEIMQKTETPE